ncbi:MAG: hypothetical protein D6743_12355 [Calditrichaeota bacterium]|nr:MAG: hypothetical protein D6743_12355 [Calditrichota bacterium]
MAFKRTDNVRSLELTSLIDVVFLLLIFFLVSFAFSLAGDASESKLYSEIELPESNTTLPVIKNDLLDNLMIQVVPDTTNRGNARRVVVLWPSLDDTLRISRMQALNTALHDSTFAAYPAGFVFLSDAAFAELPASKLISESIRKYVALERSKRNRKHPIVEVRAERQTEFKILSFIMDQCSSLKEAIPQIIIRTVP